MRIILASASPRRKQILSEIFPDFEVIPPSVDEEKILSDYLENRYNHLTGNPDTSIRFSSDHPHPAEFLAYSKAMHIKHYLNLQMIRTLIIAADTIVECCGEILNKPKDKADAERMLRILSGKTHEVTTGISLCLTYADNTKVISDSSKTKVRFRDLSESIINDYLQTDEWKDKAGAYGIQGEGGKLVVSAEGDFLNVVGFPKNLFLRMLTEITHENS